EEVSLWIDEIEKRFLAAIKVDAAHRHRNHFRAAGLYSPRCLLSGFVFTCADNQPGTEPPACDDKSVHVSIVMIFAGDAAILSHWGRLDRMRFLVKLGDGLLVSGLDHAALKFERWGDFSAGHTELIRHHQDFLDGLKMGQLFVQVF